MKLFNTFTLENEEQIEHFKEWRELYDPPHFKLFACATEIYHDPEDGKSYYRTVVDVFIRTKDDGPDPAPTEEVPGVPKD